MLDQIVNELNRAAPKAVLRTEKVPGDDRLSIDRAALLTALKTLRDAPHLDFRLLVDLTCVDYMGEAERFEVIYQLYSLKLKMRLRLKVRVPEGEEIDSASALFAVADPFEREVWDMFGVRFRNHPNLKRLLLYPEFVGHPLRKDYPLKKHQPIAPLRTPIVVQDDPPYNWTPFEKRAITDTQD